MFAPRSPDIWPRRAGPSAARGLASVASEPLLLLWSMAPGLCIDPPPTPPCVPTPCASTRLVPPIRTAAVEMVISLLARIFSSPVVGEVRHGGLGVNVLSIVPNGFCPYLRPGCPSPGRAPSARYACRTCADAPAARRRRKRRSRAHIDERSTDELEMTGVGLCSKSFIVEDTQLVTGGSSDVQQWCAFVSLMRWPANTLRRR